MSHSSLSGIDIYPRRIFDEDTIVKPLTFPPRRHSTQARAQSYPRRTPGDRIRVENGPGDDVAPGDLYASHMSPVDQCPKDSCRRFSATPTSHNHGDRVTKCSRVTAGLRIPLRPRGCGRENTKIPPAAAASLASSAESAGNSSCERVSSIATTIPSDCGANDEPEVQVCGSEDDEERQPGSEDDDSVPPEQHQDTGPETEHQANLLAAPEDSRHLYQEYYKSIYGEGRAEADDKNDDYWKWDRDRQRWFHEDAHTRSVVWFLG